MPFVNIDAPGNRQARRAVNAIQRSPGKDARLAAAQARRDRRQAKRAHGDATILFYPWPVGGVMVEEREGAYVQGPNGRGEYQAVVVGPLKGEVSSYCDAVAQWCGLKLQIRSTEPMIGPDADAPRGPRSTGKPIEELLAIYAARGPFLSIIMESAT